MKSFVIVALAVTVIRGCAQPVVSASVSTEAPRIDLADGAGALDVPPEVGCVREFDYHGTRTCLDDKKYLVEVESTKDFSDYVNDQGKFAMLFLGLGLPVSGTSPMIEAYSAPSLSTKDKRLVSDKCNIFKFIDLISVEPLSISPTLSKASVIYKIELVDGRWYLGIFVDQVLFELYDAPPNVIDAVNVSIDGLFKACQEKFDYDI